MTKLTANFSLEEFTRSDAAERLGDPNRPNPTHFLNIKRLAEGMEEVRALFGKPVRITSGYRNPRVNRAVGGVPTSAHALGHAADFTVDGMTPLEVAKRIRDSGIKFDQLILEGSRGIVHLSFDPRLRQEVKRQPGKAGTQVFWGLE